MIGKEELNRIALRTGLDLYQQEKDYLLTLFLFLYYKKYQDAIFKGGTCLKYLLGFDRFSEDLDFNIAEVDTFKEQVHRVMDLFKEIGINCHLLKEESFPDSYTCIVAVEGPLFTGTAQTRNKFRIDAGYRTGTLKKPEWKMINSEYPEANTILALVMNLEEILAEKIIALMHRTKGRDLYDIWFMLHSKIKLDRNLLQKKAAQEAVTLNWNNICTKQEYERDISKLTHRIIPYEQVKREVMNLLKP